MSNWQWGSAGKDWRRGGERKRHRYCVLDCRGMHTPSTFRPPPFFRSSRTTLTWVTVLNGPMGQEMRDVVSWEEPKATGHINVFCKDQPTDTITDQCGVRHPKVYSCLGLRSYHCFYGWLLVLILVLVLLLLLFVQFYSQQG